MFVIQGIADIALAQTQKINFHEGSTFAEIKQIAKQENKMIFIDFSTSWCKPCKRMDKEAFIDGSVVDFYKKHFVSVKIVNVMDGEGKELMTKYHVRSLPGFLFTSGDSLIHRSCGYKTPKLVLGMGIDALDPEKQNSKMIDDYNKGERNSKFVAQLIISVGYDAVSGTFLSKNIVPDYLVQTGMALKMEVRVISLEQ